MWNINKHTDKENSSVVTTGRGWGVGTGSEGEHLRGDSQEIMYNWNLTLTYTIKNSIKKIIDIRNNKNLKNKFHHINLELTIH